MERGDDDAMRRGGDLLLRLTYLRLLASNPVVYTSNAFMLGAVGATVEGAVGFDAVADNFAAAVGAGGCQGVNRTFKAVALLRLH
jgi:hypothetical protein